MNCSDIILILTGILTSAQLQHELMATYGCFESGDTEVVLLMDGNEVGYADFKEGKGVWTGPNVPPIITSHSLIAYEYAKLTRIWCMERMEFGKGAVPSIPQVKDAPESIIYPRDEEELGVENTLICFLNNFYPPPIKVNWTKNGLEVTEGAFLSRYYPNKDGTFHQFSTLSFTPQEGDVYACTVEHTALKDPKTRFWEPEVSEVSGSSAGPAVFGGVGLALGLLGVATGTFLIIKGNQRN
ncbi:H-2 class II histocompatibility antigen, A-U alpha chain-like [Coregonus clupeaformis]|uniref:H-2 class II histocompatibility antigen, A-U alpha chain-like n=1 Tax=Coregonus clupeaformis TaxID=59861 RepID=UPI001E1C5105|nr:H-2 class II histocompatibility antigen, A-U alpha chain-like [Coregonus clupeaformis]